MIFRKEFLEKIELKQVTIAFRQWKKLSISEGGTLKTPVGVIVFKKIKTVKESQITQSDVKNAGFLDLKSLLQDLSGDGSIYKIEFSLSGPDPRIELREATVLNQSEKERLLKKLHGLDSRGSMQGWVGPVLNFLMSNPGSPSREMAHELGFDQMKLKLNVRKLKNLGLTISLGTGYELSPRGKVVLKFLIKQNRK